MLPRRGVLLEVEDRTAPVGYEFLAGVWKEAVDVDAGMLRARVLGDVAGAEREEIDALAAFQVDDAESLPGPDPSRASLAGGDDNRLGDRYLTASARAIGRPSIPVVSSTRRSASTIRSASSRVRTRQGAMITFW